MFTQKKKKNNTLTYIRKIQPLTHKKTEKKKRQTLQPKP